MLLFITPEGVRDEGFMRKSNEYSKIHAIVMSQYTYESFKALVQSAFPNSQNVVAFSKKIAVHTDRTIDETVLERWDEKGEWVVDSLVNSLRNLTIAPRTYMEIQGRMAKMNSENEYGFGMPPSTSGFNAIVKEYVSSIDNACVDVKDTISKMSYSDLYAHVQKIVNASDHSAYAEKLRWVLVTNPNGCFNILGLLMLGIPHVKGPTEELVKDTFEFAEGFETTIQKAERALAREKSARKNLEESVESLQRQNVLLSEEMGNIRKAYDSGAKRIEELEKRLEHANSSDAEMLKIEIELIQGDWKDVNHRLSDTQEYAREWETIAEQKEQDIDRLRRTITVLTDAIRRNAEADVPEQDKDSTRRGTYEQLFRQAGLDYGLVSALVMKGFKGGRIIGESYLNRAIILGNTFTTLDQSVGMDKIEEQAEILMRAGAILVKKQGDVWSLNNHTGEKKDADGKDVSEIQIPVLREYLTEVFRDRTKLKAGMPHGIKE